MTNYRSLNHTKWACQYHVVFIPKYRKKAIYGGLRRYLGEVFRCLAQQRESEVEEGHLLADHVHMMLSIPPKHSVAQVVGYIKGKSAIHIAREFAGRPRNFVGQHFWARGYFVSTWVGTKRRFGSTSARRSWRTDGTTSFGWMRAATCKVAQVAAQRLRPGRFERLTAKAPGFAGGYLLSCLSSAIHNCAASSGEKSTDCGHCVERITLRISETGH